MYFVVQRTESEFLYNGLKRGLLECWRHFVDEKDDTVELKQIPKIFIIQDIISVTSQGPSTLLNTPEPENIRLPDTANNLVFYFPVLRNTHAALALAEEITKPYDINTILTTVVDRTTSEECSPRFSSTLHKLLYLGNGSNSSLMQPPHYKIASKDKCLVYTFLFGKFDGNIECLTQLTPFDESNLTDAFRHMGFTYEFCVENGRMKASEFKEKIKEILNRKEEMESCECIAILISSHGHVNGTILATDEEFTRDDVLNALTSCKELKGKPKLLIVDACRGDHMEGHHGQQPDNSSPFSRQTQWTAYPDRNTGVMSDVLQILSSTECFQSFGGNGSLFIHALCDHLRSHGRAHDLMTILNAVMQEVGEVDVTFPGMKPEEYVKQQVTFTSTLRKLLRFPQ